MSERLASNLWVIAGAILAALKVDLESYGKALAANPEARFEWRLCLSRCASGAIAGLSACGLINIA